MPLLTSGAFAILERHGGNDLFMAFTDVDSLKTFFGQSFADIGEGRGFEVVKMAVYDVLQNVLAVGYDVIINPSNDGERGGAVTGGLIVDSRMAIMAI